MFTAEENTVGADWPMDMVIAMELCCYVSSAVH